MASKATLSDMPEGVAKTIIEAAVEGFGMNDPIVLSRGNLRLLCAAEGISRNFNAAARAVAGERPGLRDVDVRALMRRGRKVTGDFPAPAKLPSFLLWLRKHGPGLRSLIIEIGGLSRKDTVLLLGAIVACEQLEILRLYSGSFRDVPAAVLDLTGMRRLSSLCVAARTSTGEDGHGFDTLLELGLPESLRSLDLCGYYLVDFQALPGLRAFGVGAGHLDRDLFRAEYSVILSRQRASPAAYRDLLTHALERGVEEVFLPQTLEQVPLWDGVEAVNDAGPLAVELPLPDDAALWANLHIFSADHFSCLPAEPVANRAGMVLRFAPRCVCNDADEFYTDTAEASRLRHLRARPASVTVDARFGDDACDHYREGGFFPPGFVGSVHAALAHLEGSTRVRVYSCNIGGWKVPLHLVDACPNCVQGVDLSGVAAADLATLERCFQPLEYTPGRSPPAWREWAGPTAAEARACRAILGELGTDREEVEDLMDTFGVADLPAWWDSIWPEGDEDL